MYGKFFASTFTGSMYGQGCAVFAVWSYVIAHAVDGSVELNPKLLAAILGTTPDEVGKAIEYLCSPDPESRNPDEDGRRLIREGSFQYRVVSHQIYRHVRNEEDRRNYNKIKQREHREKKRAQAVKSNVNDSQQMSTLSAHTEAEAIDKIQRQDTERNLAGSAVAQPAAAPQEPPLAVFPCKGTGKKEWPLYRAKVAEWKQAYPGVDVPMELRLAKQWLLDNPARGKTYNGMTAFLGRWLSKAQNHTGGHPNGNGRITKGEQQDRHLKQSLANIVARAAEEG